MLITIDEIIEVTGGECVHKRGRFVSGDLKQDSRQVSEGDCFICIKGETSDGHTFIQSVDEKKASLIIGTERDALRTCSQASTLLVDDIQEAVHKIALAVRRKVKVPVITITGASGKTTTKDLLVGILSKEMNVLSTPLNNNNLWGVPLTLVNLKKEHEVVVLETGTNAEGEVRKLTEICEPTHTYTTSIAESHLEFFKDMDGVLRGETEQYLWMLHNVSSPFFLANYQDSRLAQFFNNHREEFVAHGARVLKVSPEADDESADFKVIKNSPLGFEYAFGSRLEVFMQGEVIECNLSLLGSHNVSNALGAIALSKAACGVSNESIITTLSNPVISGSRSKLHRTSNGVFIFEDAYNANPGSMRAACKALCELKGTHQHEIQRVIALVSDMLELGATSSELHYEVGRYFKSCGVDYLFALGEWGGAWVDGFGKNAQKFSTKEEMLLELTKIKKSGDIILVKASHGAKLYEVVSLLM